MSIIQIHLADTCKEYSITSLYSRFNPPRASFSRAGDSVLCPWPSTWIFTCSRYDGRVHVPYAPFHSTLTQIHAKMLIFSPVFCVIHSTPPFQYRIPEVRLVFTPLPFVSKLTSSFLSSMAGACRSLGLFLFLSSDLS